MVEDRSGGGGLARWLRDLREGGILAVGTDPDPEAAAADRELLAIDGDARKRGPDGLPGLAASCLPTALAAASAVHRMAIAMAHPHLDVEGLLGDVGAAPVAADNTAPDRIHAVDLTFRHLPRLWAMARQARAEALVPRLESWAAAWPLSAIGMAVVPERRALAAVLGHRALRTSLLERVMAAGGGCWDADPDLSAALRSVGGWQEPGRAD